MKDKQILIDYQEYLELVENQFDKRMETFKNGDFGLVRMTNGKTQIIAKDQFFQHTRPGEFHV